MTVFLRLVLQIGLGIVLAAGIVSAQASFADTLPVQHARAEVACQRFNDGLWRGDIPQLVSRPRVIHTALTQPNMMTIMIGCGSAKRT